MSFPLTTERLVLRRLVPADREALFSYRSLKEVQRFQGFAPVALADADRFIANLAEEPGRIGTWFQLAVCLRESELFIGDIGLHFISESRVEIGYTLAPDFQGQGYATEALRTLIEHLFTDFGSTEMIACVDPLNSSSIRLLERLGFAEGSVVDGEREYRLAAPRASHEAP